MKKEMVTLERDETSVKGNSQELTVRPEETVTLRDSSARGLVLAQDRVWGIKTPALIQGDSRRAS